MSAGVELYPERNARIVQLRLEGASHKAIMAALGLSRHAVGKTLERAGVVDCNADPVTRRRAVALAAEHGAVEAAGQVRFALSTVRRWVRQARETARA